MLFCDSRNRGNKFLLFESFICSTLLQQHKETNTRANAIEQSAFQLKTTHKFGIKKKKKEARVEEHPNKHLKGHIEKQSHGSTHYSS